MTPDESTRKRKRDEDMQQILDEYERRTTERPPMSPKSADMAIKIRDAADTLMTKKKYSSRETLLESWTCLTKAVDRAQDIARLEEELKTAKAELKALKSTEVREREERNHLEFLLDIGDSLSHSIKAIGKVEDHVKNRLKDNDLKILIEYYKETGIEAEAARKSAEADVEWVAMKGRMATDIHTDIQRESELVLDWRRRGRLTGDAPATPYLDRIQHICNHQSIKRSTVLEWIRLYSDRNMVAHHPPPRIENHLKPEGWDKDEPWKSVDWLDMKEAIGERKKTVERKHAAGIYTLQQRDFLSREHSRHLSQC